MNDETQCSLEDLNQAAEELIALGCAAGAMHIHDGVARLGFLGEVSAFVDEVVEDVKEGVISAAEGVAVFWGEQQELRDKVTFYLRNGVGLVAGVVQVESGAILIGVTRGVALPLGGLLISHGTNNIYEGWGNIHKGPQQAGVIGPTRWVYQQVAGGVYKGNMAYGTMDLGLSAYGMFRLVLKKHGVQLFRPDFINYERAYKQSGRLTLFLEAVADGITLNGMSQEEDKE